MVYNPYINNRRSIRLPFFNYAQDGLYFITICTYQKHNIFGRIENNKSILNNFGKIVEEELINLNKKYLNINVKEYIVMPNHLHVIIQIGKPDVGAIHEFGCSVGKPDVGAIHESGFLFGKPDVGAIHESPLPMNLRRKMLLPKIIGFLKMNSSKRINILRQTSGVPVWQRNYYEHIIRDEDDYWRIVDYIKSNPEKWQLNNNIQK